MTWRRYASGPADESPMTACGGNIIGDEIRRNEQCPHEADLRRLSLRRTPPTRMLSIRGKPGNHPQGKIFSPSDVPGLSWARSLQTFRNPSAAGGACLLIPASLFRQLRVQGDHPPGGVWGETPAFLPAGFTFILENIAVRITDCQKQYALYVFPFQRL